MNHEHDGLGQYWAVSKALWCDGNWFRGNQIDIRCSDDTVVLVSATPQDAVIST